MEITAHLGKKLEDEVSGASLEVTNLSIDVDLGSTPTEGCRKVKK